MSAIKPADDEKPSRHLAKLGSTKLRPADPLATFHVSLKPEEVKTKLRSLSGQSIATNLQHTQTGYTLSVQPGINGSEVVVSNSIWQPEYGFHITAEPKEYGTEIQIRASTNFVKQTPWKFIGKQALLYALLVPAMGFIPSFSYKWAIFYIVGTLVFTGAANLRNAIKISKREIPPLVQSLFAEHLVALPDASPNRR